MSLKVIKLQYIGQGTMLLHSVLILYLSHNTPCRRRAEKRYSSFSFTTLALDGGEWSALQRFTPGKGPPVPIVQEAGWAPEPIWTQMLGEKSFASAGDRTLLAQAPSP
jgi:hypothetical protein